MKMAKKRKKSLSKKAVPTPAAMPPDSYYNVSYEDIAKYDWQSVLAKGERPDCRHYLTPLYAEADNLKNAGDDTGHRVYRFLGSLASLHLSAENTKEPFGPMFQSSTGRSAIVDDYSANELATLEKLVPEIRDADFRARVADVLWIRRKSRTSAETAVKAYLESARKLEDSEMWPRFIPQIERAVHVAAALGRKQSLFSDAISAVQQLLDKHFSSDKGLLSSRLMEILLEHNEGDSVRLAERSTQLATRAESTENWLFARRYWELSAAWHRRAKNFDLATNAQIRAAETFVGESEAALQRNPPTYLVAAHFLSLAVEGLRRAGASPGRIEEVHKRLVESHERSVSEIGIVKGPEVDITELVKRAEDLVAGLSFQDAIFRLAVSHSIISCDELRKQVQRHAKEFPFQHLISSAAIDAQGKVTAQRPSLLTNDPEQLEAGIRAEMFHQAHFQWSFAAQAFINPIRAKIQRDHQPRIGELEFLVSNNPFIPPGRENAFARGIHAGLTGDLMLFGYSIIPQIENSLRHVLTTRGIITSTLTSRLIQEERDLNSLLRLPDVTEIFGQDAVFEMQGLFVERFGANLRNRVAHGLVGDNAFYSGEMLYAWWLILRLLCIPVIHRSNEATNERNEIAHAPTVLTYGGRSNKPARKDDGETLTAAQSEADNLEQSLEPFTKES